MSCSLSAGSLARAGLALRGGRREGTSFGGEGWLSLGWLGSGRSLVARRVCRRWDDLSGGRRWGLWQRSPGLRLRRPQERPVLELRVLVGVELGRQFCDCGKGRARAPSGASKLRLLPHRQGRKNAGGSSHWRSLTDPQSPPVACFWSAFWLGRDRHRPCVWAGEETHRRHLLRWHEHTASVSLLMKAGLAVRQAEDVIVVAVVSPPNMSNVCLWCLCAWLKLFHHFRCCKEEFVLWCFLALRQALLLFLFVFV